MAKLGYTWYPKDWGNSDAVFELNLSERGLYRELIDTAMLNDNKVKWNPKLWSRKFNCSQDEICDISQKLSELGLLEFRWFDEQCPDTDSKDWVFIPSCESRLKMVRGGKNGGEKSKPTNKGNSKGNSKPTSKGDSNQKKDKIKEKKKEIREILSTLDSDKVDSFKLWKAYRDDIKKPIKTPYAYKLIVNKLNTEPLEKVAFVINNSIENGWQGLFWDKYDEKAHKPKRDVVKVDPNEFWGR